MAELDEAAVLAWVTTVPGLTAEQRAAVLERMEEDEYDGGELAMAKAKSLLRLLRGTAAEGAVPQLLAARDLQLETEEKEAAAVAQPVERPSCAICMEPYSAAGGVVPRMLPCGHAFCEAGMVQMLRCAPAVRARSGCFSQQDACAHHWAGLARAGRCGRAGLRSGSSARRAGRGAWSRAGVRRNYRSCMICRGRSNKTCFMETQRSQLGAEPKHVCLRERRAWRGN
jgi:hypothetical protein